MKRLLLGFSLIVTMVSAHAAPQCKIDPVDSAVISFGDVTVPNNASVGSALGPIQSNTVSVSCPIVGVPGLIGWYFQYSSPLTLSTVSNTWETGYPGIGIRVKSVNYNDAILSDIAAGQFGNFAPPNIIGTLFLQKRFRFTYQLIKTGAITNSGPLAISNVMQLTSFNILFNQRSVPQVTVVVGNTKIVAQTCTVTTPSVDVPLPTINAAELPTVGSTAGNKNFNIGLNCSGTGFQVKITLIDNGSPGNTSTNLTLNPASTAAGVKIRILNGSTPLTFGTAWSAGAAASSMQIPLIGQYIRTGAVAAGTVNAQATFTLSYQ